jgi:hypothetical protein
MPKPLLANISKIVSALAYDIMLSHRLQTQMCEEGLSRDGGGQG